MAVITSCNAEETAKTNHARAKERTSRVSTEQTGQKRHTAGLAETSEPKRDSRDIATDGSPFGEAQTFVGATDCTQHMHRSREKTGGDHAHGCSAESAFVAARRRTEHEKARKIRGTNSRRAYLLV